MHQVQRRSVRGLVISTLAAAAILITGATALGAHQTAQSGSPGDWGITDRAAEPGARCVYGLGGGTAGGTYLTGIRMRNDVVIYGTHAGLRSVAFRPIVQHRVSGSWVTVKKGVLHSGNASKSHPVSLSGGLIRIPVTNQPKNPFRLVLKLTWYNPDASVEGTRLVQVDSYVQRGGTGVLSRCKGFVSDF